MKTASGGAQRSIALHSRVEGGLPGEDTARIFPNLACVLVDVPASVRDQLGARQWARKLEIRIAEDRSELAELYALPR